MERNMDLCRQILFKIEKEYVSTVLYNIEIPNYSKEEVNYHCQLLYEEGLISDYTSRFLSNELHSFKVRGLTWDGHDFLKYVRDNTVWHKTKQIIKEKSLELTFDIIRTVAMTVISSVM